MKKSLAITAFVSLLLLAADEAKRKGTGSAPESLDGSWVVASGESNGKPAPEDAFKDARMTFAGDKLTASSENGKTSILALKIDTSGKVKTIDITNPEKKQTLLGIFALQGKTLKLCLGSPGAARPTAFSTKEGSGWVLFVLAREK
jgi:uncharacterized protein (TIGR03067 family)